MGILDGLQPPGGNQPSGASFLDRWDQRLTEKEAEYKKKKQQQSKSTTPSFRELEERSMKNIKLPEPSLWDQTKEVGKDALEVLLDKLPKGALNTYDKTVRPALDEVGSTLLDNPIGRGIASGNPFLQNAIEGMSQRADKTEVQNPITAFAKGYKEPEKAKSGRVLFNENYTGGMNVPGMAELVGIEKGLKTPSISELGGLGIDMALDPLNVPVIKGAQLAGRGIDKLIESYKAGKTTQKTLVEEIVKAAPEADATQIKSVLDSLPKKQPVNVMEELDAIFGKTDAKSNADDLLKADVIPADAPKMNFVKNSGVKVVDNKASKTTPLQATQNIGDADSFRSKVSRPDNGLITRIKELVSNTKETAKGLRTQFVDDVAPLEKLEKDIRGSISSAEDSLYKQARLFKGSPTKAHEIIRTELGPVMDSVQAKGFKPEDLGDYSLAVHAKDVNSKGIESGFTNQEIDDVIQKYGSLEQERAALNNISKNMLDTLKNDGVISKELVDTLNQKWPNYMPLFRAFDDSKVDFAGGLSKNLANVTNPIKGLKGSQRQVVDPLESMVKNIFRGTNAADRNRVATQLSKLAKEDANGAYIRQLAPNEEVGRRNVVSVLEDGQRVRYEVPEDVYTAMMNLDQESSNLLIKILQAPASALRAGATLTPEFSMRNWIRDVPAAFITSKSGFNPLIDFPVGLANAIGKGKPIKLPIIGQLKWNGKDVTAPGKWYHEFVMNNGGYGNIVSMDRRVHQEALEKVLQQPTTKKFVNIVNPKAWLELLQAIADISETGTKVGEFRAAKKKTGVSDQEAAYRARDVMDFARAGYSIREANKVVAFLNANIQGKSKLYRAFKENPAGSTAKAFTVLTAPTLAVYYMQKEWANEEQQKLIKDAPDWLRNSFWLVPVPMTDQVARIPKPFDLAPLFANLPERMMEEHFNNNPQDWADFTKDSLSSAAVPVMLTGIMPFLEGMANYSFFRQGPIIPQRENNLEFPDQYDVNTSEVAKLIGSGVDNVTGGEGPFRNFGSPRVVDNTIRGMFGGLGSYTTSGIDGLLKLLGTVQEGPEKPDKFVTEYVGQPLTPVADPLFRAFFANQDGTGKAMDELYKEKERLTRAKGSAKERNQSFADQGKLKLLENGNNQISDINKQMRLIQENPNLDGTTKRQQLQVLNKQRNEMARQIMDQYKKY